MLIRVSRQSGDFGIDALHDAYYHGYLGDGDIQPAVRMALRSIDMALASSEVVEGDKATLREMKGLLAEIDSKRSVGDNRYIISEKVSTGFRYKNNPMDNPKASIDIVENPNAVYGYSPNPGSSLDGYVNAIDWTNPEQVKEAVKRREDYHNKNDNIVHIINEMRVEGFSPEAIAWAANNQRNINRLNDYINDQEGLERVMVRNEIKYGSAEGPTAEYLYKKYGSWEKVIEKSMSSNLGMDACCGLYDKYYHLYGY